MARATTEEITEVTIPYNLFDLPTAQHKAGLAGLVLAIRSLKNRSDNDPEAIPAETVPEIVEGPTATSVHVRFTDASLSRLLFDLFDVNVAEAEPVDKKKTRNKGKVIVDPVRTVTRSEVIERGRDKGQTRRIEEYVYLRFRCRLPALSSNFPSPEWLKLWQDFIHGVIRDNTKDGPFRLATLRNCVGSDWEQCAKAQYAKLPREGEVGDDEDASVSVEKLSKSLAGSLLEKVSGSLWIGAQGKNAENIESQGLPHLNLLLNFWHLTMMVFVPSVIDSDGKQHLGKKSDKDKGQHYISAIPEVSGLARFVDTFPRVLAGLDKKPFLFRPAGAVVILPAQASLEFIKTFSEIVEQTAGETLSRSLNGVEFYHLMRPEPTKSAVLIGTGRVSYREELLTRYRDIVGTAERPSEYYNPLFKAALIQALLRGKPWWGELLPLFMNRDWRFFVQACDTPSKAPDIERLSWFWLDVRRKFEECSRSLNNLKELKKAMNPEDADNLSATSAERMPDIIRRIVAKYVMAKTKERTKDKPEKVNEERERIAQSLFLEFRSRKDQAFVDHFANTFFAVGQWYDPKQQEYQTLASYLLDRTAEGRDDLKTLTLAALSAVSWIPQEKTSKGDAE